MDGVVNELAGEHNPWLSGWLTVAGWLAGWLA